MASATRSRKIASAVVQPSFTKLAERVTPKQLEQVTLKQLHTIRNALLDQSSSLFEQSDILAQLDNEDSFPLIDKASALVSDVLSMVSYLDSERTLKSHPHIFQDAKQLLTDSKALNKKLKREIIQVEKMKANEDENSDEEDEDLIESFGRM